MKSPFKFLDSYTLDDRSIFFGRDQEITDLYRRVFESKMLLVYGVSGTGKSSLINCGLASRFDESDWLPVNIRRGSNIVESLNDSVNKHALTPLKKNLSVAEKLQSVYLDHFKPVFLIFDQFEELFIFGSEDEKKSFIKLIKEVIDSKIQCRVVFVIREEFLAGITEFEYDLPEIFSNRFRVEKMKRANAILAVEGPCRVHGIETETGFSEELIDKLCPAGNEIELTYLQIYLDRIFRIASEEKEGGNSPGFSKDLLTRAGSVSDLLGQFLDEQIREMDNPDIGMAILKSFVSIQGTKKQMTEVEILDSIKAFGKELAENDLIRYLEKFVDLRILRERDESGHFELRHDALATKIYEKFTAIEKDIIEVRQFIENAYSAYEKRGKLLADEDLKYIAPYEEKLFLSKTFEAFIIKSKNEITRARNRRIKFTGVATIAFTIILIGFTLWALIERNKATLKEQHARANNYNFLAKEATPEDPTIAFRLAEYAAKLDPVNNIAKNNLNRIYYDNNLYRIISPPNETGITDKSFSPDGNEILSGYMDGTIKIHDINGNLIKEWNDHQERTYLVSFSSDGKYILTSSLDNTTKLWDLNGNIITIIKGNEYAASNAIISPDNKFFLTHSNNSTVVLWDIKGNLLKVIRCFKNVYSVAFSPDVKQIAIGLDEGTIELHYIDGNLNQFFKGHKDYVKSVAFSPDGKYILSGSADNTARLWDLKGKTIQIFSGHVNSINSASYSSDGQYIITCSDDKTVRLWDLNGNNINIFRKNEQFNSAVFSSDNKYICTISRNYSACIWKIKFNPIKILDNNRTNSVTFSSDGKYFLAGISGKKEARLFDVDGNLIRTYNIGATTARVAFSPDGTNFITTYCDRTVKPELINVVKKWDLGTDTSKVFKGQNSDVVCLAYSPNGKYIAEGLQKTAILLDLDGNTISVFKGHGGPLYSIAFSPDSKKILTGSFDRTARLWDLKGNLLRVFKHQRIVTSVAFSPDGKKVLTGSIDKTAKLWDLEGNTLQTFKGDEVLAVAFSSDGKYIVTGDFGGLAKVWDLNGNVLQILDCKGPQIWSVAFSPDGKYLLTGFQSGLKLWELKDPLENFSMTDSVANLSTYQRLRYGIITFDNLNKSNNKSILLDGADYYLEEAKFSSERQKQLDYINIACSLFEKARAINNDYETLIDLYEVYGIKAVLNQESDFALMKRDKIFRELIAANSESDLIVASRYFYNLFDEYDVDTVKIENCLKAILFYEKLAKISSLKNIKNEAFICYGNLSDAYLRTGKFANALSYAKKALEIKEDEIIYTNIFLSYVLNNQYDEAKYILEKHRNSKHKSTTLNEYILLKLGELEETGITHPDFEKVKEMLKK